MANENSISKERQIINEILEKVKTARDKRKITKKLWISERLYDRDNQAAVGLPGQYEDEEGREVVIEPNADGTNISLVRYVNSDLYGGVDVKTIDEAFKQIKYFAKHGELEDEDAY
jgi:hypothetical protein